MIKSSFLKRVPFYILLCLLLLSCSIIEKYKLDMQYGISRVDNRQANNLSSVKPEQLNTIDYATQIKPVLNKRCVVCHACYDAPCQLKLTSIEGLERGASKTKVYQPTRLTAASPTRLYEDALTTEQWRSKNFFPVLNERRQDAMANLDNSVLARLLMLKQQHPLPDQTPLPDSFDFSLDNASYCTTIEEYPHYERKQPLWGMPYGLPSLPGNEYQLLLNWLAQGAPTGRKPSAEGFQQQVQQWEKFLNQDSLKHQLMSRYIYEHLFMARIYFSDGVKDKKQSPTFFHLVRSATPPGKPVQRIVTRRPYDDPGVERVYYRLVIDPEVSVSKTNMPYLFNQARQQRYQELFIQPDYQVNQLPGYSLKQASNPFITFADIPVKSRYKFMLDEAEFTIMGFIKGPVCRGQIALNVIQDHFWVFFVDPDVSSEQDEAAFLLENLQYMNLPAQDSSTALVLNWLKYSRQQQTFLKKKSVQLSRNHGLFSLNTIWDGDNKNRNAALTVFRHFDSATVVKGLVGNKPKTAWVIDYSLLERIHYLLVAGFDIFGNYGHQLNTRLYMDFMRMEGEYNFLAFLPKKIRPRIRDEWYAQASDKVKDYIYGDIASLQQDTDIVYHSKDYKNELLDRLIKHIGTALDNEYVLDANNSSEGILLKLQELEGKELLRMPQVAFLLVEDGSTKQVYSIIHNNAHLNLSHLLNEGSRRISDKDTLTVVRGFLGSYPNVFFKLEKSRLKQFVQSVMAMHSDEDYKKLLDDYAVRRNNAHFWAYSDQLHHIYQHLKPVEFGFFDYNRLNNQ